MDKDKDKSNLTVLNGKGIPDKLKESMIDMKAKMPIFIENIFLLVQLTRAKYNALLAEGFTEAQALELSKTL